MDFQEEDKDHTGEEAVHQEQDLMVEEVAHLMEGAAVQVEGMAHQGQGRMVEEAVHQDLDPIVTVQVEGIVHLEVGQDPIATVHPKQGQVEGMAHLVEEAVQQEQGHMVEEAIHQAVRLEQNLMEGIVQVEDLSFQEGVIDNS